MESGYGASRFDNEPLLSVDAFDRELEGNPFAEMSYVFVPYCTGDLHAGDKVQSYTALGQTRDVHHRGGHNVDVFLDRLGATFDDVERVFVAGSSAGGYGAQLNLHKFRAAFPDAETHVLSDCGPLVQPYGGRMGEMNAAWDLQSPEGCADCGTDLPKWFDHLRETSSGSRVGLLAYDADQTIHLFFGYPLGDSYQTAFTTFADDRFGGDATKAFILGGTQHVMLGGLMNVSSPDGVRLSEWVGGWVEGDQRWEQVAP